MFIEGCSNGVLHVIAMATGSVAQTLNAHTGIVSTSDDTDNDVREGVNNYFRKAKVNYSSTL